MENYRKWFADAFAVAWHELKKIFTDSGVMVVFFVAGLGYPLLYNFVYSNGILENVPIAVVDHSHSDNSRRYIRKMDATRELMVAQKCATIDEAKDLMQRRKVKGIVYFPKDYAYKTETFETGVLSIYADMSSFLYYKNLMLGANFVMLDEIRDIKMERCQVEGLSNQETSQLVEAVPYDDNNPYNRTFSYSIFFLSAALLLIVQQVMLYGMIMRSGTDKERGLSYMRVFDRMGRPGLARIVLGRSFAYWILFLGIGIYVSTIVPAMFSFPQRGNYFDILLLLLFYVTDCVFFASYWSSFFTRRETGFVTLLFVSPIALFLTGFSWPTVAFPAFWKLVSYIFPSTFACPAFINLNTAACDLSEVRDYFIDITIQACIYCALTFMVALRERLKLEGKEKKFPKIFLPLHAFSREDKEVNSIY